jgi:Tannase and feruloyl esterase
MDHRRTSACGLALLGVLALFAVPVRTDAQSCGRIASLKLPDTSTISALAVPAGEFPLPGGLDAIAQGPPHAMGRKAGPMELPAFCRVQITVAPAIKMEVWLPESGWNGDFEGVGNGGKAGSISYPALATALKSGYATASTDTGHEGSQGDARWALGHPELVTDFAYRAIHEMTVTATKVVRAFYGRGPRYSFFNGCSTGGRQGLMEAERYPKDYNGVLTGDPVIYYTHLQAAAPFWVALLAARDPQSYIPPSKLSAINEASVAACDAMDGVKDGLIEDPRKCGFRKDPSALLCKGADSPTCLTAKQLQTLKEIYGGYQEASGQVVYPGSMPGHEEGWGFIAAANPAKPLEDNTSVGLVGFFKYFVFENPDWDYQTWNYQRDLPFTDKKLASILNATDPDLKAFQAHGGKLLLYHGWTDPSVSPLETISYYKNVVAQATDAKVHTLEQEGPAFQRSVSETSNFVRLFMVPGMDHCGGGPGPNMFDAFGPLTNWVEHQQAPEKIIASHIVHGAVVRTRPLCPYPMTAQYAGQGSINDAANFVCKLPRN